MDIRDNLNLKGTDIKTFVKNVYDVAGSTSVLRMNVNQMDILAHRVTDDNTTMQFYDFSQPNLKEIAKGGKIKLGTVRNGAFSPETEEEIKNDVVRFVSLIAGKSYVVSGHCMSSLTQISKVSGDDTFKNGTIFRDMHMIDALYSQSMNVTAVVRTNGRDRKIFAFLKANYKPISQAILIDIYNSIQYKKEVKEWSITQNITNLVLTFPEFAISGFVPGCEFNISDTGKSSFEMLVTVQRGDSSIILDRITFMHKTRADENDIKERILEKIKDIPDIVNGWVNKLNTLNKTFNAEEAKSLMATSIDNIYSPVLAAKLIKKIKLDIDEDFMTDEVYSLYSLGLMLVAVLEMCKDTAERVSYREARTLAADIPMMLGILNK